MLTSNIDISEKLINGKIGTVSYVPSHKGIVKKIYVNFDDRNANGKTLSFSDHDEVRIVFQSRLLG